MKIRTRIVGALLVMLMTACLFGCGKGNCLEGTKWTMTGGESGGTKVTAEQLKSQMGEVTCEFKKDNVVTMTALGEETSGKYKVDDKKVTLSDDKNQEVDGIIDGDKLTLDYKGVKIELAKNK